MYDRKNYAKKGEKRKIVLRFLRFSMNPSPLSQKNSHIEKNRKA